MFRVLDLLSRRSRCACLLSCFCYNAAHASGRSYTELVELFSRRDFVCDCGTSRLGPEASCTLSGRTPATSKPHADNKYDHTFVGEFCICEKGKTYDPATEEDEMFQCLVCEECAPSPSIRRSVV